MHAADRFALSDDLAHRVLDRLGVAAPGPNGLEGLEAVYRAWCRGVPFDNITKRLFQAGGAIGTVPGSTAREFFATWLERGIGGTCWSSTIGLTALLSWLGFDARLVVGTMLTDPSVSPNHSSTVVTIDGSAYLVDTSMLYERPLLLDPAVPTHHEDALHPVRATPHGGRWTIEWMPGHFRSAFIACDTSTERVADTDLAAWHDRTRRQSLFNDTLFIRRNLEHSILSYGRGKAIRVDARGTLSKEAIPSTELPGWLVEQFGIAPEVVASLPPDVAEGEAFL
jgi:N-hydroxyarylamine O-acetyltransferase